MSISLIHSTKNEKNLKFLIMDKRFVSALNLYFRGSSNFEPNQVNSTHPLNLISVANQEVLNLVIHLDESKKSTNSNNIPQFEKPRPSTNSPALF